MSTWVPMLDRGCTCARRSDESRVQEAGHGKDCMRELHADMVLGCVHERLRRGYDAHTIVAPQDIHQVAVPECRPHLCMHKLVCSTYVNITSLIYAHPMEAPRDVAVLKCMPHLPMHTLVSMHLFALYTPRTVQIITSEGEHSTLCKQLSIYRFTAGAR